MTPNDRPIVQVGCVIDVQPHPDNDKLNNKMDVVTIAVRNTRSDYPRQHVNVANRPEPNTPRYKVGDFAVMLTEGLILPDWVIKHLGMWDTKKNKGGLAGKEGNRLKSRAMGIDNKVVSEVALFSCGWKVLSDTLVDGVRNQTGVIILSDWTGEDWPKDEAENTPHTMISSVGPDDLTPEGVDVAWNLGIEKRHIPQE